MINLFERFNASALELYHTLKRAGHHHTTVVLNDDGFLPQDAQSPYQFFSNFQRLPGDCPTYFNEVELPRYYEIDSSNDSADIKDMGIIKGKIHFRKNYGNRIVERVDWLDKDFKLRKTDHYCAQGFVYAESIYDINEQLILRNYLDRDGRVIIYHNFVTNDIVLTWNNQDYFFNSQLEFTLFYLEKSGLPLESIIFNSLALPYSVSYHLKKPGKDYLFWQETIQEDIPGNMKLIFNNSRIRAVKIAVPDRSEYHRICEHISKQEQHFIVKSGYIYEYIKENSSSINVLNVTNSDQLAHIEEIAVQCPEHIFHIAALTEMSSKLLNLSRFNNVRLYPRATMQLLRELYQSSDIYIDINEGGEIVNAVRSAFDYNMLILGYRETAHNILFTDPVNLYHKEDFSLIVEKLNGMKSHIRMQQLLAGQKQHANEIDIKTFNKLFE